jgi:hypothetical protein
MHSEMKQFVTASILTAVISVLITGILKHLILQNHHFASVYFLIVYVSVITILFHSILLKAAKGPNSLFVNRFIAFSGMKLMIYLMTIIIYIFFIKSEPVIFLLSFILLYFVFTTLEITSLLKYFKKIL